MNFWVDILDGIGNKLGSGPITEVEYWENTAKLDGSGNFEFAIPLKAKTTLEPLNYVRCMAKIGENISEIFSGIILSINYVISSTGEAKIIVRGQDMLDELNRRSVGILELNDGNGGGVSNALQQILAKAPSGWSLDTANGFSSTEKSVYAQFRGETVLGALTTIAKQQGEHFRLGRGRKLIWLRKQIKSTGLRGIQGGDAYAIGTNNEVFIVKNIEELRDTSEICSRVYAYGSGIGDTRLTLAACNRTPQTGYVLDKENSCLINTQSEAKFGRIERTVQFKNIAPISNTDLDVQTAANMLFDAAQSYLETHKQVEKFYRLNVSKVSKPIMPGESVRIIVKQVIGNTIVYEIDADLVVLEVKERLDSTGIKATELVVATIDRYYETDESLLVSALKEVRILESHTQMSPNSQTISFIKDMDDSKPAQFDFWLGREVVNVAQVLMRFKISPLRSNVKTILSQSTTSSSGGGTSSSTSSGGGTVQTSASATLYTFTGIHKHTIKAGARETEYDGFGHTHWLPSHNHQISIPPHTHSFSVPAHSHAVTPSVSLQYGIFEDSTANKLREGPNWDISFWINGTNIIVDKINPVDGAWGWWELDLTEYVCDGITLRPLRTVNRLEMRAKSSGAGRRALIEAQLLIRTTICGLALI